MMAEQLQQIEQLEKAIRHMIVRINELRAHNDLISRELASCKTELEGLKSVKKQEEQNNNFTNIAQHIKEKGASDGITKEQLAQFLDYIDQCLEFLNK